MKKLIIVFCFLGVLSCKKSVLDPTESSCEKASAEYEKVLTAWSNDITNKSKCEDVKKALTNIINRCSVYTAAQRKVYEDQIRDIDCN
ncbi:MAG: hypothetical protein R2822_05025 [Spirosomataceae bacterium]